MDKVFSVKNNMYKYHTNEQIQHFSRYYFVKHTHIHINIWEEIFGLLESTLMIVQYERPISQVHSVEIKVYYIYT